jgi:DNA gyrase subunit A
LEDKEFVESHYIVMCTQQGTIKKTLLEEYSRPRRNGVNAINVREDDQLVDVVLTNGHSEILMATWEGKAIRFNEENVRAIGRTGTGVRGVEIEEGNKVVGMASVEPGDGKDILVLSEKGYGKRTDLEDYRVTNRGGKGVKTIQITEKTGNLVALKAVTDENDLMIINRSGTTIRTSVADIRVAGRATQGVRIINLREGDSIASVMAVPKNEDEEAINQGAEGAENAEVVATEVAAEATATEAPAEVATE